MNRITEQHIFRWVVASFILLSAQGTRLYSQADDYNQAWRVVRFTTESGLPSNYVTGIAEAPDGTAWVTSSAGVAWYDGYRWIAVDSTMGLPRAPASEIVADSHNRILVESAGRLYLGNKSGFAKITDLVPIGTFPFSDSSILIYSGLSLYLLRHGAVEPFSPFPHSLDLTQGKTLNFMAMRGGFCINALSGLYKFTPSGWECKISSRRSRFGVISVAEDSGGNGLASIFYPDHDGGLWEWGPGTPTAQPATSAKTLVRLLDLSPANDAIAVLQSGDIQLRHNHAWSSLSFLRSQLGDIIFVKFRTNGDLWIGTSKGLFLYRRTSRRWESWKYDPSDLRNVVEEILRTRSGDIWLGTAGGLDIHRSDGTVQYITEIAGQSLYGITGLAEDQDGNIWISSGASFDGTYCWNRASWTYYKIGDFPGGVRIHKIRKDRSGKLWFLGISNDFPEHSIAEPGAFCFDDGRFVRWGVREGMVHGRVYSFAQGCDGAMWFGTWRGISRWKEGKWTTLTTRQGLRGDKIFTLAVDSSNRVWFGNRGNGLGYFDEELRPHYLTTTDGLVNDDVWDLNVDSHGTLWISTSGGVASLRDGVFSRFDTKAGLIQAQVWPILPSDESVYIGTKGNGLDILNLKADAPLPVRIYPEKPITDAGNALLRWRVLSFWGEQPSDIIQVRYRLGDEPWTDWTAAREVTMDKLAPGEYAFTIEAANLFGSLNNSTEKVLFNIAFPLYRRPVFLVPVVALTLAVVFLGMNQAFRKRKHASALRESEAKFRRLTEATFEGIAIHDNGTMIDANPSILKIFGYELGEFVGKSALEFTAPESHEAVATNMVSENDEPYEAIGIRKDGSRIAVEIIGKMIPYDGRNLRVVAVRDITARKQAEAKLLSYQSQLRSLASEVSMSEERERRRMAEYLHNYIGQTLALCKIKLGTPPESASDESRKRHTDEIRALLDQMIHDTQSLTFDLSPPVLYELGFEDAIEWLTDQMQGQHNTVFSFQTDGQPKPLGSDIRVLLFHAVRELLVNTVKHAKAQEVTVSLERQDSQIIIRVEDDGTGFDRAADRSRDSKGGFGLFNIRERIAYFGGRMDIESGNGFGTRVTLSAPLEQTTMPQRRPEQ